MGIFKNLPFPLSRWLSGWRVIKGEAQKKKQVFRDALILILLLSSAVLNFVKAGPIVIVKNHEPKAIIVLEDSASEQLRNVAKILQDYIKQSTDALLPIATQIQKNNVSIHIGLTSFVRSKNIDLKNLDPDGFILRTIDPHDFVIVGGSDWGTEFGVYSFLERYLDVNWLMPSEIGTYVPKTATLKLPNADLKDVPVYISRQISPLYIGTKTDLGIWTRFNRLKGRINFSHNLLNLIDPKQFGASNPDFFPLLKGKRVIPSGYKWQPDFSAPGIADSASENIIRYFKKDPKASSYSLGINDYTIFDQSATSLARRNGKKNFLNLEDVSDDYFEWVNEVVSKVIPVYPHKLFGLLAYNNVATPPSGAINSHVVPFLTYERMRWADTSLRKQGHQLTTDWGKKCSVLGWYDYIYGLNYLLPRVWFHTMQKYLLWGSEHTVKYYYAELYPNWSEGPKPWILSKLLWNPNRNVDSLLNIWYVKTAGKKAAPKLKEFYAIWEKFWTKDILDLKWSINRKANVYLNFDDLGYLNYVPVNYVKKSNSLIEDAYKLAKTEEQKQRVDEIRKMWEMYRTAVEIYQTSSGTPDEKKHLLSVSPEFVKILNGLEKDPLHGPSITIIKNFFKIS